MVVEAAFGACADEQAELWRRLAAAGAAPSDDFFVALKRELVPRYLPFQATRRPAKSLSTPRLKKSRCR
jgi:hypothetical protein